MPTTYIGETLPIYIAVENPISYIDYIQCHTTGQTTYATGDLNWIAIEGGDIVV